MNLRNDIGWAVENLKGNARVRRRGWNGKGMWIAFSPGVKDNSTDKFWSAAVREFGMANKILAMSVSPYVVMFTADRQIVPWLCSQSDLLADDWELA